MIVSNVLSLFNGMSCGYLALQKAGFENFNYASAEIDKYANLVTSHRFPNIYHFGDVTKWQDWQINWGQVDLVLAGFPCQAWSLAGKQMGDKDPRGALFWTTLEIIKQVLAHNPNAKFMMENVKMKREFEEYITFHTEEALGYVEKTLINSALVSAQNRNRYYWTNFKVSQPEDKGILLRDIVEPFPDDTFNINPESLPRYTFDGKPKGLKNEDDKSHCLTASMHKGFGNDGCTVLKRPENLKELIKDGSVESEQNLAGESQTCDRALKNGKDPYDKANSLTACSYKGMGTNGMTNVLVQCGAIRGQYLADGVRQDGKMLTAGLTTQQLEVRKDEKTNTLTTVQKDNVVVLRPCEPTGNETGHVANATDINGHDCLKRVYSTDGKSPTLNTMGGGNREPKILQSKLFYRKLTPLECERLQTVPDNFTLILDEKGKQLVSNSQRYKMIGNGWTVDVIAHILSHLKDL